MVDKKVQEIIKMYTDGVGVRTISERTGVSIGSLYNILEKNKVALRSDQRHRVVDVILAYFDRGMTIPEICIKLKIKNVRSVESIIRAHRPVQYKEYKKMQKRKRAKIELEKRRKAGDKKKLLMLAKGLGVKK